MNTRCFKWLFKWGGVGIAACCCGLPPIPSRPSNGYTVHEWGTFTSVQRADGTLLEWHPLESSQLPKFVYDWHKPGLARRDSSGIAWSKSSLASLQRMETPVIYFYSDHKQTVDASVHFPQGIITEWYPQADRIGPATALPSHFVATLDTYAQKIGAKPNFTLASLLKNHASEQSLAEWKHVEILPVDQDGTSRMQLPTDSSGSHYFSARETDANYLKIHSFNGTNSITENEKFIFYRGVGNFSTPLRVMSSTNQVSLMNTGAEPLDHLFIVDIKGQLGTFVHIDRLAPGSQQSISTENTKDQLKLSALSDELGKSMAEALVKEGLYPREASAMVSTWRESWFKEEGVRVLYVLSRDWTDGILPLKLEPAPQKVVRVMVGRAEILSQPLVEQLSSDFTKAADGDIGAASAASAKLKRLGRFAEPAAQLATESLDAKTRQKAWASLRKSALVEN